MKKPVCAVTLAVFAGIAGAQTWPQRPITLIVPFPPGGSTDTVKILANPSPARSSVIPAIPTSEESGIPGLYASGWFGFFAPCGTPKEVIARLNGAMVQALVDPAVRTRFTDLGLDVASREQQSPESLAAFQKAEIEKWWPIIKAAGIKVE